MSRCDDSNAVQFEDVLLGMELSCLAYLDDTQETIKHEVPIITRVFGEQAAGKPLTRLLVQRGYVVDKIFSGDEAPGFIAHRSGEVVVGFRGSTSLGHMPANSKIKMVPFHRDSESESSHDMGSWSDHRRVHVGWYRMLLSIRSSLDAILLPLLIDRSSKRLILAGHSRGGSLACLALAYLLDKP